MSDTSQGPGWWLASDGKWYPPEQAPGTQAPQPPPWPGSQPGQPQWGQPGQPQWGQPAPKKSHTVRNLLIALAALTVVAVGGCAVLLVAGGTSTTKVDQSAKDAATSSTTTTAAPTGGALPGGNPKSPTSTSSFVDGVLTTPDLTIKITDTKTIPVGAPGNEYGQKPVIAFWYEITNLTDKNVTPMNWIYVFSAYQDNNPNAVNELEVASLPDARFRDTQTEQIKNGGTVQNAVAYELDDDTTPVSLVASKGFGSDEIGRTTYNVR